MPIPNVKWNIKNKYLPEPSVEMQRLEDIEIFGFHFWEWTNHIGHGFHIYQPRTGGDTFLWTLGLGLLLMLFTMSPLKELEMGSWNIYIKTIVWNELICEIIRYIHYEPKNSAKDSISCSFIYFIEFPIEKNISCKYLFVN